MKNTEPGFWKYFLAYALICIGTGLIVLNIIGWVFLGEKEPLVIAFFSIWLGVISLAAVKKAHPRPSQDQAEKK